MARIAEGVGTVWVRSQPGSGDPFVSFTDGDEVPSWASAQLGAHVLEVSDDAITAVGDEDDSDAASGDPASTGEQSGENDSDGDGSANVVPSYEDLKVSDLKDLIAERNEGREDEDQILVPAGNPKKAELVSLLVSDDAITAVGDED